MKRIAMFTGSRSEFGLLKNLAKILQSKRNIKFDLIISGSHLSKLYGKTISEILKYNIKIFKKIKLPLEKNDRNKNVNYLINQFSNYLNKFKPDTIILLGDRFETFAVACASVLSKIRIVHIHGGEITKGSRDDLYRHSISKMSDFHFVSTSKSAKRLVKMGEDKMKIFNYGAMCNDSINQLKKLSKVKVENLLGTKFSKKNILISYHPETYSKKKNINDLKILFRSLYGIDNTKFIFSAPNFDENSHVTLKMIKEFCRKNKNAIYIDSLGHELFLNTLRFTDILLGNSSSGIIEAGLMKKYSINLGKRQLGRERTSFVVDCQFNSKIIKKNIEKIFQKNMKNIKYKKNPYHGINVAKKISSKILMINFRNEKLKYFKD